MVGAEHANARAKLGTSKRNHVLPNMGSNHFSMLRGGVVEDPLDQVVAILIASNIDQRNASTVSAAFADAVKVTAKKVSAANL